MGPNQKWKDRVVLPKLSCLSTSVCPKKVFEPDPTLPKKAPKSPKGKQRPQRELNKKWIDILCDYVKIFCHAQPQLKVKLQLEAEVAIFAAWSSTPSNQPSSSPPTLPSIKVTWYKQIELFIQNKSYYFICAGPRNVFEPDQNPKIFYQIKY